MKKKTRVFVYFCPECKAEWLFLEYREKAYCPNCGAELLFITRRKEELP